VEERRDRTSEEYQRDSHLAALREMMRRGKKEVYDYFSLVYVLCGQPPLSTLSLSMFLSPTLRFLQISLKAILFLISVNALGRGHKFFPSHSLSWRHSDRKKEGNRDLEKEAGCVDFEFAKWRKFGIGCCPRSQPGGSKSLLPGTRGRV